MHSKIIHNIDFYLKPLDFFVFVCYAFSYKHLLTLLLRFTFIFVISFV
jgi:hypothetical protein